MKASISVIIPCYKCISTIERALLSITTQTLLPLEVILVEDKSPDQGETLQFLYNLRDKYQKELNIIIIPQDLNDGPGTARNAGWEEAQGKYIAFLDADDSWHPQKLEIQYNWMEINPKVVLTGHQTEVFEKKISLYDLSKTFRSTEITRTKLLFSNRFPTRSVMLIREISQRFEPGKRQAEDFLLWLNIVLSGKKSFKLELPLAYSFKADYGEAGLSAQLWKMEKGELDTYQRILKNKLINKLEYFEFTAFSLLKFFRRVVLSKFQPKKFL